MGINNPKKMDVDDKKLNVIDHLKSRFPPTLLKPLIESLRPSLRLTPASGPTRTYFGGSPDTILQEGWPLFNGFPNGQHPKQWAKFTGTPIPFIAQIDLTEITRFDDAQILPVQGLLRFFYLDAMTAFNRYPENGEIFRVIYQRDDPSQTIPFPEDLPQNHRYHRIGLQTVIEWTLPPPYALTQIDIPESLIETHLILWDDLSEEIQAVQGFAPSGEPIHRMLGYPDLIQWPDFDLGSHLLLQIDSDITWKASIFPTTGMVWGDAGRLNFQISRTDLQDRRWQAAWCTLETA